jgi:hypothetical protein
VLGFSLQLIIPFRPSIAFAEIETDNKNIYWQQENSNARYGILRNHFICESNKMLNFILRKKKAEKDKEKQGEGNP